MSANGSVTLLKKIYENAKTGTDAISLIINKTYSNNFKSVLSKQREIYYEIANEASMLLQGYRELPSDTGIFLKLGIWASVQMNTVASNKIDRMAEVLINASTEGIIEIMKILHINKNADSRAISLANRLICAEQDNIKLMQKYL